MSENYWKFLWSKDQVKAMLLEQFDAFWERDPGIGRIRLLEVEQAAAIPHAVIISGLRRVGKSTLLAQMAHKLGPGTFYYINFEDDRFLGFQAEDASFLYQVLVELFGERKTFIIDEIQNIPGWEHFVRRFMDMGFKFYITGSNASLLSRELGTRLTGRYVPIELFPFSFSEFLKIRAEPSVDLERLTTVQSARLKRQLEDYLKLGGIPDALKYPQLPILRTLYDDVLFRDIATRHQVDAVTALKELAFYLLSNPASKISYNKLKEQFRLGSINTIKNYVGFMENSWLIFTINVYDFSLKRQQIAPKKVFCIDPGLSRTVGFNFSPNTGKLLENAVFLALRQRTNEIYYITAPGDYEVDFYLPVEGQLIQVTHSLENPATREREIRAITEALQTCKAKHVLVLADADEESFIINGVPVEIRAVERWLLEQRNKVPGITS